MPEISTAHGVLRTPCYIPDATRAAVRAVDASDLEAVGVPALMVNSFHLTARPGVRLIQQSGGLHRFMGWSGPIVTDSGGFQAFSMIRQNAAFGTIRDSEIVFRPPDSKRIVLTPEKVIRTQLRVGSDVLIALDDCTSPEAPLSEQQQSVARTVSWCRRGLAEFALQLKQRKSEEKAPLLVAPVQGGASEALRRECAGELVDAGFQAFGFGGWPIDEDGKLQLEMFELLCSLLPPQAPLFALGVGKPEHLVAVSALRGGTVFDSSLATRDARRQRLYRFLPDAETTTLTPGVRFYEHVYLGDAKHALDHDPVSPSCDALCCTRYSAAYLHHLVKCDDPLVKRLATLHNLRFFAQLSARLQVESASR